MCVTHRLQREADNTSVSIAASQQINTAPAQVFCIVSN